VKFIDMLLAKFRDSGSKVKANGTKKISPKRIVSADMNCPHGIANDFESLVKGAQTKRSILLKENIVLRSPLVRLFFRTGEGQDHTPMVTGHLVVAHVREQDGMNDMLEVTIRVNAEQAAQLPFLEVYDA
jgi:hypothetical protein